ncbi:MAG: hypothetical protein QXK69_12505 [Candidatus Caldarchaeum sp.]
MLSIFVCRGMKEEVVVRLNHRRSYANGYRYCSHCRRFLLVEGLRCPFCGRQMRWRPRKSKHKQGRVHVELNPEDLGV